METINKEQLKCNLVVIIRNKDGSSMFVPKKVYSSLEEAERICNLNNKYFKYDRLYAYRCCICGGIHINNNDNISKIKKREKTKMYGIRLDFE